MNGVVQAILSEWAFNLWWYDEVNAEAKALMGKELFMTNQEVFMGCEYAKKKKENV